MSDQKGQACKQCGMWCRDAGEFHPYVFCVLFKAGRLDPWTDFVNVAKLAGLDTKHWPDKPPLIRHGAPLIDKARS